MSLLGWFDYFRDLRDQVAYWRNRCEQLETEHRKRETELLDRILVASGQRAVTAPSSFSQSSHSMPIFSADERDAIQARVSEVLEMAGFMGEPMTPQQAEAKVIAELRTNPIRLNEID